MAVLLYRASVTVFLIAENVRQVRDVCERVSCTLQGQIHALRPRESTQDSVSFPSPTRRLFDEILQNKTLFCGSLHQFCRTLFVGCLTVLRRLRRPDRQVHRLKINTGLQSLLGRTIHVKVAIVDFPTNQAQ